MTNEEKLKRIDEMLAELDSADGLTLTEGVSVPHQVHHADHERVAPIVESTVEVLERNQRARDVLHRLRGQIRAHSGPIEMIRAEANSPPEHAAQTRQRRQWESIASQAIPPSAEAMRVLGMPHPTRVENMAIIKDMTFAERHDLFQRAAQHMGAAVEEYGGVRQAGDLDAMSRTWEEVASAASAVNFLAPLLLADGIVTAANLREIGKSRDQIDQLMAELNAPVKIGVDPAVKA